MDTDFKFFSSYIQLLKDEFNYLQAIDKYVDIIKDTDPEQKDDVAKQLIKQCPQMEYFFVRNYMSNSNFREYLVEQLGRNSNAVVQLAPIMRNKILRSQKLCTADHDYYIGLDPMTNTAYICYKSVMMIDFDFYKSDSNNTTKSNSKLDEPNSNNKSDQSDETTINNIKLRITKYCQNNPNLRFRLYRSQGGIHAFLISQLAHFQDLNYIQMGLDLGCDFYYMIFVYLRGWSVRVNRKIKESPDKPMYSFLTDIGRAKINPRQEKLINLHLNLEPVFNDIGSSKMYGG